jgi:hypothetical protein
MNLPHRGKHKMLSAELIEEAAAVLSHLLTLVGFNESQVEPRARGFAEASPPCAERMDQPLQFAQPGRFKPGEAAS